MHVTRSVLSKERLTTMDTRLFDVFGLKRN
jgi:hypothetical protein